MRAIAILITVLVLLATPASALLAPPLALPKVEPLPPDVRDADVLLLLAAASGLDVERLPLPSAPAGVPLGALVMRLGERAGAPVAAEDAAAFDALDPQLKAPVATLLVAVDQAWTIRDEAFAGVSEETLQRVREAKDPEARANLGVILSPEEFEKLLAAAIMLSDTIESIVIPQLEAAAQAGVWPAIAVADPVGVLRIGGTGNDVEPLTRIVALDARGNDRYNGSVGASTLLDDLKPQTFDTPVGVAIDLSGNDEYRTLREAGTAGGGGFGIGVHYDLAGADYYDCDYVCLGGADIGVGIHRDVKGDDVKLVGTRGSGSAFDAVGYARDDAGDDRYPVGAQGGGHAGGPYSTGLLWDRAGTDRYQSRVGDTELWGVGIGAGRGLFVDETSSVDQWEDFGNFLPHPRACNGCQWEFGRPSHTGRGNDGSGGLSYLLARQDPYELHG